METWLWDAACAVRGATDAPKFKDFILPLVFFKRLSDVFDDALIEQIEIFGDEEAAREIIAEDHRDALLDPASVDRGVFDSGGIQLGCVAEPSRRMDRLESS